MYGSSTKYSLFIFLFIYFYRYTYIRLDVPILDEYFTCTCISHFSELTDGNLGSSTCQSSGLRAHIGFWTKLTKKLLMLAKAGLKMLVRRYLVE